MSSLASKPQALGSLRTSSLVTLIDANIAGFWNAWQRHFVSSSIIVFNGPQQVAVGSLSDPKNAWHGNSFGKHGNEAIELPPSPPFIRSPKFISPQFPKCTINEIMSNNVMDSLWSMLKTKNKNKIKLLGSNSFLLLMRIMEWREKRRDTKRMDFCALCLPFIRWFDSGGCYIGCGWASYLWWVIYSLYIFGMYV